MNPARLEALRKRIGHDLRSPLAVVLGQCEILQLELHGPLNQPQRAAVASIEAQVERMLELVDAARLELLEASEE